jgi:hypothetical protein
LNLLSSIGALILATSFALFFLHMLRSARVGPLAGPNPWGAGTLEWLADSPPGPHNFDHIPVVTHATPLWAERESLPIATGISVNRREILITTLAEARPEIREASPDSSIWPLLAAIATTIAFIASIFSPWAAVWGSALIGLTLIGWFWPKSMREDEE